MSENGNSVNMEKRPYHHGDLRTSLIAEGLRLLDAIGPEGPAVLLLSSFDQPPLVRTAFERGAATTLDYAVISKAMDAPEVVITVDLGLGTHAATAWGCDLTEDYVRINADYTT